MSRPLRDLELVRGSGIAELRGFATYNVVDYATVRFFLTANMVLQSIRVIAEERSGWTVRGLRAVGVDPARNDVAIHVLSPTADLVTGGDGWYGWSVRSGISLRPGMHELLNSNTGWRPLGDRSRRFRAAICGLGDAGETITEVGSDDPIRPSSEIVSGPRWLVDLGGTVWRFIKRGHDAIDVEETTMPHVESELLHADHVDNFVVHYAHHPGAPIRFVSLHVWNGKPWSQFDAPSPQCAVLYGIDETSDRLVLEIGRSNIDYKSDRDANDAPFFDARFNLNGLSTPWWWENACRATAK